MQFFAVLFLIINVNQKYIAQHTRSAIATFPIHHLHRGYSLPLPVLLPPCLSPPPHLLSAPATVSYITYLKLHLLICINHHCFPPAFKSKIEVNYIK